MAQTTPHQRQIMGRVMHEFEHGELYSGPDGKGGKVTNRQQAIAIALKEAGASTYESEAENEQNLKETERKQAKGETAQQEAEGRSHIGAEGERESSPAMGGENAEHLTEHGAHAAHARARKGPTYDELYDRAKRADIRGRSKMAKQQLANALNQ
ncbi:MAG: hypothetical protein JSR61_21475 [Proteobacteria bacterium]|nr:hypothetical protein [Pseudomonadota bacterium]